MAVDSLIGQRFGKLTVIGRAENSKSGKARWICKCDCGSVKKKPVFGYDLKTGRVRSCGCIYFDSNKGRNARHGMYGTRLYGIWAGMKQRCKRDPHYKHVSVCDEWQEFIPFRDWALANGYRDDLTLDRVDNSGNYEPSNCRWATYRKQENNRNNNHNITIGGVTKTIAEWSRDFNISCSVLSGRLKRGWPEADLPMPADLANARNRKEKQRA